MNYEKVLEWEPINENTYDNCSDCNLLNLFQPCETCHNLIAQAAHFTPKYETVIINYAAIQSF